MLSTDKRWKELGEVLTHYSLDVQPGQKVMIAQYEVETWPLALATYESVIKAGGFPQIQRQKRIQTALGAEKTRAVRRAITGRSISASAARPCWYTLVTRVGLTPQQPASLLKAGLYQPVEIAGCQLAASAVERTEGCLHRRCVGVLGTHLPCNRRDRFLCRRLRQPVALSR